MPRDAEGYASGFREGSFEGPLQTDSDYYSDPYNLDLVSAMKSGTQTTDDSPQGGGESKTTTYLLIGGGVALALIAVVVLFFLSGGLGKKAKGARAGAANTGRRGNSGTVRRGAKRTKGHSTGDGGTSGGTERPAEHTNMDVTKPDGSAGNGGRITGAHAIGSGNVINRKSTSTTPSRHERKKKRVASNPLVEATRSWPGKKFTADLRRWLAAVKEYKVTEPGVSVTSMSVEKARHDLSSKKANATFRHLRASGVRHYGVLDFLPTNLTEEQYVQTVLRLFAKLRKMHARHVPKGKKIKQYFGVGVAYVKHADEEVYTAIEKAASNGEIQLVILRTHLGSRDDANRGDCRITGSTVWGKPVAEQHPSIASARLTYYERESSASCLAT
ncbi:hypothetical protein MTO96_017291 [Rhipicephalus appendiculatus]